MRWNRLGLTIMLGCLLLGSLLAQVNYEKVTSKGRPITLLGMKPDGAGIPDILAVGNLSFFVIHRGSNVYITAWPKAVSSMEIPL